MEFAQDRYASNSYDEAFQQTQDDRRLLEIIPTSVPKHGGIHGVNSTTSDLRLNEGNHSSSGGIQDWGKHLTEHTR